ncbi:MAG: hypothetical protein ACRELB_23725, partial [Polyangiaceae bacterium]
AQLLQTKRNQEMTQWVAEVKDGDEDAKDDLESVEKEYQDLQTRIKGVKHDMETAMVLLRKAGVGPSNRIRKDAKVSFIEGAGKLTGGDVHAAKHVAGEAGVDDFLRTGGRTGGEGQAQQEKSKALHDELRNATRARREGLDEEAEKLAKKEDERVKQVIEKARARLVELERTPPGEREKMTGELKTQLAALRDEEKRLKEDRSDRKRLFAIAYEIKAVEDALDEEANLQRTIAAHEPPDLDEAITSLSGRLDETVKASIARYKERGKKDEAEDLEEAFEEYLRY